MKVTTTFDFDNLITIFNQTIVLNVLPIMKAFKKWIVVFASTIFATLTVLGQTNSLIIPSNISLPRDTVLKKQLITDLNGFLAQKEKPNKENTFVLKADLLATSILLDEMKGMEKSLKLKVDTFYKANLQSHNSSFYMYLI